jgi:hypothetical protein
MSTQESDGAALPALPPPGRVVSEPPAFFKDDWKHYKLYTADQMRDYARAAVADRAAVQAEPVAWINGDELANMLHDRAGTVVGSQDGWRRVPLYASPPAAAVPAPSEAVTEKRIAAIMALVDEFAAARAHASRRSKDGPAANYRDEVRRAVETCLRLYAAPSPPPAAPAPPAQPLTEEQFKALSTALQIEHERAVRQRDDFLRTGVSTTGHGGSHDTCFDFILRRHGITGEPRT